MLQSAGDLGLHHEARTAGGFVGVAIEHPLEGHLAMQLRVHRDEDSPQATPCMRPEHAEAVTVGFFLIQ